MKVKRSPQKPDPRLEVLLERIMDAMPQYKEENRFVGESTANPMLYTLPPSNQQKPAPSETLAEDILEVIDPLGISSWDDAKRAYESYMKRKEESDESFVLPTFDEFVDVLGAVPVAGKFGKVLKGGKGAVQLAPKAYRAIKSYLPEAIKAVGFGADRTEHYRDEG